ncbi:MAG: MFS transporter [Burkholderiales bacterium]
MLAKLLKIETGERTAFIWSFAYFFCLLCGYYILRPVRSEMGIQSGVTNLPALMTVTFVTMLAVTPLFGWVAARFPRARMLPAVYGFFILNLIAFYFAFESGFDPKFIARAFFVWLSVFNLFVVSVFWSFMTDLFEEGQAKRLFPVIAAGGSLGAIVGSGLIQLLVKPLGMAGLMLMAAGFLGLAMVCIRRLARWSGERALKTAAARGDAIGGNILAGIRLAFSSPYLIALCVYIFLLTWTSVVLYLENARIVAATFTVAAERTTFFARVEMIVSVLTLVCQLLLTNRLIERMGLAVGLLFLPAISVIGFLALGTAPVLLVLVIFDVARRVGEYAISKPAREVLFTVLDRESKYKAKNFIDTAVTRGGEAASGWISDGIKALGATGGQVAFVAAPIAALWGVLGWWLAREQARRAGTLAASMPAPAVAVKAT